MKISDIIAGILKLLDKPEKWTQGTYARNENASTVGPLDPQAVCWCLEGAIIKICGGGSAAADLAHAVLLATATKIKGCEGIVDRNDDEVMTFYKLRRWLHRAKHKALEMETTS